MTPLELRLAVKGRGYNPIPVNGKIPHLNGWQNKLDTTEEEIRLWSRLRPTEENTGVLTLTTPAFDIDILDLDAADAIERLVRDRFEELGDILVRFGRRPKRAILFRTDAPFEKVTVKFVGDERLEVLSKGQQVVVAGVHPDTRRPYEWYGGSPCEVDRASLPYIHAEEAQELVDVAARMLVNQFGYQLPPKRRPSRRSGNVAEPEGPADWSIGPEDLIDHDKLAALAMQFVKAGMAGGAVVNMLRSNIEGLEGVDEERRTRRLREVPGIVSSAEAKLGPVIPPSPVDPPSPRLPFRPHIELGDFYAFMGKSGALIFAVTGVLWPGVNVDRRIPPIQVGIDDDGEPVTIPASRWLFQNKPVDQMTWAPGEPPIIENRLMLETGFIDASGKSAFNLYHAPVIRSGDPAKAKPWLELGRKLYPDDFDQHLLKCFAHRVQRPGDKINHAVTLGGPPGIGKDSLLAPVLAAVGAGNVADVSPTEILDGKFTGFRKCIIMRISEAHDIGDAHRRVLYERMKTLCAAPPETLRVNEKNIPEYYVLNVCFVVITTNHKMDALYLPEDDRRNYVAWSRLWNADFDDDYWRGYWKFLYSGGVWHVVAYLQAYDLSDFDPKAPPPKTQAFKAIVNASRSPDDAEMADALDALAHFRSVDDLAPRRRDRPEDEKWPKAVTIDELSESGSDTFRIYMHDPKNRRAIPHRLNSVGYEAIDNPASKEGLWTVNKRRATIYVLKDLSVGEQRKAAMKKANIRYWPE